MTVFDLKSVHTSTYNSPQVLFECGTWKQRTKALNFAGKNANWNNVGFSFIMKNMTYLKISVLSRGIIIGTCKISTRELLEVPKDSSNHVILTRTIEVASLTISTINFYYYYLIRMKLKSLVRFG